MRELSVAEYRTILTILAHPSASERQRILLSRLPSSTYNVVRRRAFEHGWLSDIMVPNPGPCGFAGVELRLARPSLSMREDLLRSWTGDSECVLLWAGLHATLGVFFRSPPERRPATTATDVAPTGEFRMVVDRQTGSIPVYFDYSGLWARFGGQPAPPGYPAALDTTSEPSDPRALIAAGVLLQPGEARSPVGPRWTNLFRLARPPRRALEKGVLQPRTILNVPRLPPFDGRRIGEIVIVHGRIRTGAEPQRLLNALVGECGVFPFLVAESRGQLILAGVGQTSSTQPGRVPVASARRPVLETITEQVDPAEVVIEPVEAIDERVGHRYSGGIPALSAVREDRPG